MSNPDPPHPPKLPVWRTVVEAYRLTLTNIGALGALAWAWLLVLLIASTGLYWSLWSSEMAARRSGDGGSLALVLAAYATSSLTGAAVAVGWHRYLLLGETPESRPNRKLDGRVARYVAILVAPMLLIVGLNLWVDSLDPAVEQTPSSEFDTPAIILLVFGVVAIALFALVNRLMLILPAIAVEARPSSFAEVWRRTRGNTVRLLLGTVLTLFPALPGLITIALVEANAQATEARLAFVLRNTLYDVAAFVVGMVAVTFLTVGYRALWPALPAPSLPSVSR